MLTKVLLRENTFQPPSSESAPSHIFSQLPLGNEGARTSLMAPNTAPSFLQTRPQVNKGSPHGNEVGSKRKSRQLSLKGISSSLLLLPIWSFKSLTKVGMGVGKMLGDFFLLRPREGGGDGPQNREVRHRRPRRGH